MSGAYLSSSPVIYTVSLGITVSSLRRRQSSPRPKPKSGVYSDTLSMNELTRMTIRGSKRERENSLVDQSATIDDLFVNTDDCDESKTVEDSRAIPAATPPMIV